ncbi:hypothetical protein ABZY20_27620 [Streptomyces sp. NPDC006624]|uniref:hypothetical protein n=1 Tax=unclassified Streptomyces TaxID=2593676 RepID=UPI0033A6ECD0
MTRALRLRPEDRADFEAVLHQALRAADIRDALRPDPAGRGATHLRAHALAHADAVNAAAGETYRDYLAVRRAARQGDGQPNGAGGVPAALAVLTPLVAATAAAALLLLGGVLRLAGAAGPLPGSLTTAGWTLALVAAVTGLVALAALLHTAVRRRAVSPAPDQVEHARLLWRRALLDHGMLPHLRRHLLRRPGAAITPCSTPGTLTPCPARAGKDRTPCSD